MATNTEVDDLLIKIDSYNLSRIFSIVRPETLEVRSIMTICDSLVVLPKILAVAELAVVVRVWYKNGHFLQQIHFASISDKVNLVTFCDSFNLRFYKSGENRMLLTYADEDPEHYCYSFVSLLNPKLAEWLFVAADALWDSKEKMDYYLDGLQQAIREPQDPC